MNKKIVWALALVFGFLGIGLAVYSLPKDPKPAAHANHAQHGGHAENQIQAPPPPPRQTPVERVVAVSR